MNAIEPGTPVRVTIEGKIQGTNGSDAWLQTAATNWSLVDLDDPAVQVVPVDPERPTLEQVLESHEAGKDSIDSLRCKCSAAVPLFYFGSDAEWHAKHVAERLRAAGVAL